MFRDKKTLDTPFSKGEKVMATEDLGRVPAGTTGKVRLVDGFEWTRYWVFFDNGEKLGSVDGSQLVRPRHYEAWKTRQEAAEVAAAEAATAAEAAADAGESSGEAGGSGQPSATTPSGVTVPSHLLERSRAARTRLGA